MSSDTSNGNRADPWQFPKMLLDGHANSRRAWRTALKKVRRERSWLSVTDSAATIDVRPTSNGLVYGDLGLGLFGPQASGTHWFLNHVSYRTESIKTPALETMIEEQELFRSGLGYLWYTIAYLGKCSELPFLFGAPNFRQNQQAQFQALVDSICYWLPEIVVLGPRLTYIGSEPDDRLTPEGIPQWIADVGASFTMAGYQVGGPMTEWDRLYDVHREDPITFFELLNMIERDGTRYRPSTKLVRRDL